ncbi:hypothetical protein A6R68_04191, partial [Neotoma lepida]
SHPLLPTVIDGVVLPKTPEEILAEKNFNTVPYMVGITKKEFGWSMPMVRTYGPLSSTRAASTHTPHLCSCAFFLVTVSNQPRETNISESLIPAAIEKYLSGTDDPVRKKDLLLDLMGDVMFGAPSVIVSRSHR